MAVVSRSLKSIWPCWLLPYVCGVQLPYCRHHTSPSSSAEVGLGVATLWRTMPRSSSQVRPYKPVHFGYSLINTASPIRLFAHRTWCQAHKAFSKHPPNGWKEGQNNEWLLHSGHCSASSVWHASFLSAQRVSFSEHPPWAGWIRDWADGSSYKTDLEQEPVGPSTNWWVGFPDFPNSSHSGEPSDGWEKTLPIHEASICPGRRLARWDATVRKTTQQFYSRWMWVKAKHTPIPK